VPQKPDSDEAKIDEDVEALNASVMKQMPNRFKYWKNYRLRGAVWIDKPDSFKPDANFFELDEATNPNKPKVFGTVLKGERRLSNPTMETFSQGKVARTRIHSWSIRFRQSW
jgi:hypothetical protein